MPNSLRGADERRDGLFGAWHVRYDGRVRMPGQLVRCRLCHSAVHSFHHLRLRVCRRDCFQGQRRLCAFSVHFSLFRTPRIWASRRGSAAFPTSEGCALEVGCAHG